MRLPTRREHRYAGSAVRNDQVVTSVRTWTPPDDSHPVTLIGVLHIGTADYYAKIVELANADPDAVVLYEGVRPVKLGEDPLSLSPAEDQALMVEAQASFDAAHQQSAGLLGLALHQATLAPHYSRPNWHNADLDQIDIMRAVGVDPAARTAIDGSSMLFNTLFTAQTQAALAVARRGDGSPVDIEEARAETRRLAQDIVADAATPRPGRVAAAAALLAQAAETNPVMRLRMMNNQRNQIRWATGGAPWPLRCLWALSLGVPRLIGSLRGAATRANVQHREKIICDWRDFHCMSLVMRSARTKPVVVIYGGSHMRAQCEFLARNGFTQTNVSWLEVMSVANPKGKERKRVLAELTAELAARAEQREREAARKPDNDSAFAAAAGATPAIDR